MAENVEHIVERIRAVHRQLAECFERAGHSADSERARLILTYIGRHERHLAEALEQTRSEASRSVLNTWFKNTPGRPVEHCLDLVKFDERDLSAVLKSVLEMDRCLVESFRRIAESAVAEEVKQFFQLLIEMEEREEHRLIRDAIEVDDL